MSANAIGGGGEGGKKGPKGSGRMGPSLVSTKRELGSHRTSTLDPESQDTLSCARASTPEAPQLGSPFGVCSITGLPAKYKDPVTGVRVRVLSMCRSTNVPACFVRVQHSRSHPSLSLSVIEYK